MCNWFKRLVRQVVRDYYQPRTPWASNLNLHVLLRYYAALIILKYFWTSGGPLSHIQQFSWMQRDFGRQRRVEVLMQNQFGHWGPMELRQVSYRLNSTNDLYSLTPRTLTRGLCLSHTHYTALGESAPALYSTLVLYYTPVLYCTNVLYSGHALYSVLVLCCVLTLYYALQLFCSPAFYSTPVHYHAQTHPWALALYCPYHTYFLPCALSPKSSLSSFLCLSLSLTELQISRLWRLWRISRASHPSPTLIWFSCSSAWN